MVRLIVAPRNLDVLKTNICPRSEALRANVLVLGTSNFQGATIRLIVLRHTQSILFIVHHKFSTRQFKIHFQFYNVIKKTGKTHLKQFQLLFISYNPACLQKKIPRWPLYIRAFFSDGHIWLISTVFYRVTLSI